MSKHTKGQYGFFDIESQLATALASKFFHRIKFVKITEFVLRIVNSTTSQIAHFCQTARFQEKFNCQGSKIYELDDFLPKLNSLIDWAMFHPILNKVREPKDPRQRRTTALRCRVDVQDSRP